MKRTLSLLLVLVMVFTMVPNVFAAETDNSDVDFGGLLEIENYSPLTVNLNAGAEAPAVYVWTPAEDGTLSYDLNDAETTVSIILTQGEATATSEAGVVSLAVVANEPVEIEVSDINGAAIENLVINGTFGTVCEHVAGEAVQENVVEATCTVGGSYDSVVYCSLCGEKMSSTAVVVDALGHSWGEPVRTEATTEANAFDTYTCTVCGETKVEEVPDSILPAFAITTQPTDQSVEMTGTATFRVEAIGAVSYQWQRIQKGATAWSNIPGATEPSYSVKVTTYTTLPYRCVLTDAEGNVLTTNEVTIVLLEPLVNILNEPGNIHVIKNSALNFTVELDNEEGVTYQWQRCKDGVTWTNVSFDGCKTKTLSFYAASWAQFPTRCVITDANGTKIYTESYTYTLYEPPVAPNIVTNPKDVNVVTGGIATFFVVAEGTSFVDDGSEDTGLTYQWWRSKDNGVSWGEYTADDGYTSKIDVKFYAGQEYLYFCEVKDGYGNTLRSKVAQPHLVNYVYFKQPTVTVADGAATFSFRITNGDVKTLQWERLKADGWVDANNDTTYVGNDTTTMTTAVKGTFRCRITDMAGNVQYTNELTF